MTFTLTQSQRAACDAFEQACRELCVDRMTSIEGGLIGRNQVTGGVQDGTRVYWPDGYKMGLADRLEASIRIMQHHHAGTSEEGIKKARLAELEREADAIRKELDEIKS